MCIYICIGLDLMSMHILFMAYQSGIMRTARYHVDILRAYNDQRNISIWVYCQYWGLVSNVGILTRSSGDMICYIYIYIHIDR